MPDSSVGAVSAPGFIDVATGVPSGDVPSAADLTGVGNTTNKQLSNTQGGLLVQCGTNPSGNAAYVKALAQAKYTVTCAVIQITPGLAGTKLLCSICLRDSVSGKLWSWGLENVSSASFAVIKWTDINTISLQVPAFSGPATPAWCKLQDDGTNRKVYLSPNGIDWLLLGTFASNDFLVPDQIGVIVTDTGDVNGALYKFSQFSISYP